MGSLQFSTRASVKLLSAENLDKNKLFWSSCCGSVEMNLISMRTWVQSLAPLSGLRIQRCHELWYRLQTQLGSQVAVAVALAGSCNREPAPSLGTSI